MKDICEICILCHVLAMSLEITKLYCITIGLDEPLGWKDIFELLVRIGLFECFNEILQINYNQ